MKDFREKFNETIHKLNDILLVSSMVQNTNCGYHSSMTASYYAPYPDYCRAIVEEKLKKLFL